MRNSQMTGERYIFKEEIAFRSKAFRFIILSLGEIVFAILLLFTIQLFKIETVGINKVFSYAVAVLFSIMLVLVALFTWGFFHSHIDLRITKSGVLKRFKIPPFVAKEKLILMEGIKSISKFSTHQTIYKNEAFTLNNFQNEPKSFGRLIVKLKDGKTEVIETANLHELLQAFKLMFNERGN